MSSVSGTKCSRCGKVVSFQAVIHPGWQDQSRFCRDCFPVARAGRAKPGLVEVVYGAHDEPAGGWDPAARGYAFLTAIKDLRVGDVVLLPGNWRCRGPQLGTVVSLSSAYEGEAALITRRATGPEIDGAKAMAAASGELRERMIASARHVILHVGPGGGFRMLTFNYTDHLGADQRHECTDRNAGLCLVEGMKERGIFVRERNGS